MRVISHKAIREAIKKYADLKTPLDDWYQVAVRARWLSLEDIRKIYPTTDRVSNFLVFNIKGNKYRLICGVDFQKQILYIKHILTHADYDKEDWKNDPYF